MRVLLPPSSQAGGRWRVGQRVPLDKAEAHHVSVRRARDHEGVEVLDGAGLRGSGHLVESGRSWLVELRSVEWVERPPETTLAVAAGDRERFSWMVEKSVELGVSRIVPLVTARSAGVATRLRDVHLSRLRRSALESLKQCGVVWAPSIEAPLSLTEFLQTSLQGGGWLADPEGEPVPATLDRAALTVVIGPEGGLSDTERSAVVAAGYRPVALGFQTLRFETAALAAAAAVTQARMRGQDG
jgi:16S rRNA (uracil1498-N3)-methyltransferase